MRRGWIPLAACAAVCSAPLAASGQDFGRIGAGAALEDYPLSVVDRPLTLPFGAAEITAPLGISLSSGDLGEPTFLNPSIAYGVTDRLTVGIRHFLGLCFTGADGNCPKFYNDLSVSALYSMIRAARLEIAGGVALNVAPISDPTAFSGEVRLPVKFGGGLFALVLSPTLDFGLNERGSGGRKRYAVAFNAGTYDVIIPAETQSNREVLRIPLTFQMQLENGPALLVGGSIDGELDPVRGDFSDEYRIPIMGGLLFTASRYFDLGVAFTFPDLLGQHGTADDRILSGFVALRM